MGRRMIHRYWQGPPPPADHAGWLAELNPRREVITWTRNTLPVWVVDLIDRTAPLVVEHRQAHHAANVARIGLLYEHGGHWVDHDIAPHAPLPDIEVATAAHRGGSRCNCWLAFPPAHPVLADMLVAIATTTGPQRRAVEVSGEQVWWRVCPPEIPALPVASWATHEGWTSRTPVWSGA